MASRSVVKGLPTWITSATFSDLPTTFPGRLSTGSGKTLGTILRDPIVPSSVGQVGLSRYSAIFSSQSAR